MNLKEALKAAIDGHKIRAKEFENQSAYMYWDDKKSRFHWSTGNEVTVSFNESWHWEIVSKPVKHTVELWFSNKLNPAPSSADIWGKLFGMTGTWSPSKSDTYNNKIRITVEEVQE